MARTIPGVGRRLRRPYLAMLLGVLIAGLAGCATFDVRTDWDPTVRFGTLQRYAWLEPPRSEEASPFADNDLLRKRVRLAVERALDERGYRQVESAEDADFLVTWSLELEERVRVNGSGVGGYYHSRRWWGGYTAQPNVRNYQESTLVLDILDAETRELIWRGWASGIVRTRDRDRDPERLFEGVRKILSKFPPERADESSTGD